MSPTSYNFVYAGWPGSFDVPIEAVVFLRLSFRSAVAAHLYPMQVTLNGAAPPADYGEW